MFISWNEQRTANTREKELIKARVRAHAARIAHQRQLDRQKRPPASTPTKNEPRRPQSRRPLSIPPAWHGGSDPFNCRAIQISPQLNQLLDFVSRVWVPASHIQLPDPFPESIRSAFCTEWMLHPTESLDDDAMAITILLPYASALATLTKSPDLEKQSIEMKLKTMSKLRTSLAEVHKATSTPLATIEMLDPKLKTLDPDQYTITAAQSGPPVTSEDSVVAMAQALFIAAVNDNSFAEATFHGEMLQRLMKRQTDRYGFASLNSDVLCQALVYDLVRAQLTFTPSIFDLEGWLGSCQSAFRPIVLQQFQTFREKMSTCLDPSLADTPLQQAYLGTHQCFFLWSATKDPEIYVEPDEIWSYVTVANAAMQLWATNYLLELQQVIDAPTFALKLDLETQAQWLVRACLTLGLLLWQVTNLADLRIAGQSFWPRGTIIFEMLHRYFSHLFELSRSLPVAFTSRHENAFIFFSWMGAVWVNRTAESPAKVADSFFHRVICRLAAQRGLQDTDSIREIVKSFLPSLLLLAQDWKWLERLLPNEGAVIERKCKHPTIDRR
ncbi:uncharacterized protein HMPREF1541_06042 [Cyphellophora europaea CBS 101466]|uniref:Transcription factor domain-containing protein n=1 Tax=Cyphellophora europaea (strain CBS 101466) TaxID=1220924 RepID=W2RTI0_CYPE1|nr:uncharacterized protein HMPREF1541_06042 [Cyphellophora europaea CBS 101466]ETN39816.1 hypothetical protein HMPREF1541_06042 [Cyphellophora europaea CBS 101466]